LHSLLLAAPRVLPIEVATALERARVPSEALVAMVQEVGSRRAKLGWQADQAVNPASLMKLFTTFAALELLGPAWTWTTPVWLQGSVKDGVLEGNLVIKGNGDPKLVLERMWLLLRRVQQLGVNEIRGDIVLDRSAFAAPDQNPGDFDGEPLRPYNVGADALLLSYKSVVFSFTPDPARGVAWVGVDPSLADVRVEPQNLPLVEGACNDWRAGLKADVADPLRI
jgi:serine-type D-Ala-D-Ala carboxypeptidase/endopeptidase (penicillin-binding protein 4)